MIESSLGEDRNTDKRTDRETNKESDRLHTKCSIHDSVASCCVKSHQLTAHCIVSWHESLHIIASRVNSHYILTSPHIAFPFTASLNYMTKHMCMSYRGIKRTMMLCGMVLCICLFWVVAHSVLGARSSQCSQWMLCSKLNNVRCGICVVFFLSKASIHMNACL